MPPPIAAHTLPYLHDEGQQFPRMVTASKLPGIDGTNPEDNIVEASCKTCATAFEGRLREPRDAPLPDYTVLHGAWVPIVALRID